MCFYKRRFVSALSCSAVDESVDGGQKQITVCVLFSKTKSIVKGRTKFKDFTRTRYNFTEKRLNRLSKELVNNNRQHVYLCPLFHSLKIWVAFARASGSPELHAALRIELRRYLKGKKQYFGLPCYREFSWIWKILPNFILCEAHLSFSAPSNFRDFQKNRKRKGKNLMSQKFLVIRKVLPRTTANRLSLNALL